ncbi:probable meiotically up-regulated gene 190 protein [Rhynchosporium agropyri]|uniref:Probable meiotically up-regulated gene 190 protein n=1 Tax=Rhynchosporium agropyri TaxID=914238 RepID=A0A1E1KKP1_9HELO|nr:probable meiotically up-regulated gene 190 protein [Rhynchosporium agropyri]
MTSNDQKVGPGSHYSGTNPIPNIQQFLESLDIDKKERDKKIDEGLISGEVKDHSASEPGVSGTRKSVTDPTTGRHVEIEDVDKEFMRAVEKPQASLATSGGASGEEYRKNQDITAPPDPVEPNTTSDVPIHGEKTTSYEPMFEALEWKTNIFCASVLIAIVALGKLSGGALYGLMKDLIKKGRAQEWSTEKTRGETATANLIPESVEWINTFLGIMWGLIDPDTFASIADTLEDIMQASVPRVIENVRVTEINHLRALPDSHVPGIKNEIHTQNKQKKDSQELLADEEGGDHYNLECSFAYHAAPTGAGTSEKARNMHMQLVFYLGMKGLFGVPLPIFVELQGLVGTVRLRLQLSPEPPFLKSVTFTLMGLPKVQAGCVPLIDAGINVLDLPLISRFVNHAIGAAANEYVAPKSMILDMTKLLKGDDIQEETEALGVLWIRIHRATGLSKQDRHGSKGGGSDPYVTDDLNPIWEETCALLVTPELIKADEQLSMELWDSDRATADDVVGKVELSMQKMIQHPGKMYPQVSRLCGIHKGKMMPGELHVEVGYFGKVNLRPALKAHGKDVILPDELSDRKELQDEKGSLDTSVEEAVVSTPPDPLWPSGICCVVIHQIVNLELQNLKRSQGKLVGREFEPAKPSGENKDEENEKLPSGYCTILYNDELVYRSRTKAVSSKPIFNAGTERFIRDWRSSIGTVRFEISHDPILGVIPLKLSEILQSSSQVTRWYPLHGGTGFGRIRISLLFRSVETRLTPVQLGWDVGTFEFTSDKIHATGLTTKTKLRMRTGGSSGNISRAQLIFELHSASKRSAEAYAIIWLHRLEDNKDELINIPIWKSDKGMRLTQNYITEDNYTSIPDIIIEEIGRLQFRGRFKAGTNQDHSAFVTDNDSRETQETWAACNCDAVRESIVTKELPQAVKELHDRSLMQDRDLLSQADKEERQKWLSKDGTDWRGAFGEDPARLTDHQTHKRGVERTMNENKAEPDEWRSEEEDDSPESDTGESDLGFRDATNHEPFENEQAEGQVDGESQRDSETNDSTGVHIKGESAKKLACKGLLSRVKKPVKQIKNYNEDKQELHRKQKGPLQWRPVRNLQFAKNEAKFVIRRALKKGTLQGRKSDVESEF